MGMKTLEFEDLPVPCLELDCEWSYYYDAGRYSGRPEDCYPEEEESEIELETGWEEKVKAHYQAAALLAVKEIEDRLENMSTAEWAADDRESYAEARAEAMMEERRCYEK